VDRSFCLKVSYCPIDRFFQSCHYHRLISSEAYHFIIFLFILKTNHYENDKVSYEHPCDARVPWPE
jgi:hypothetical protein